MSGKKKQDTVSQQTQQQHAPLAIRRSVENAPLAHLTDAKALEYVTKYPEEAARVMLALIRDRTAELPGTMFVRREGGVVKRQTVRLILRESQGHLVYGAYTLEGLRAVNQIAALNVMKPPYVMVEGQKQGNPYIERDEKTSVPRSVYCRALAVGLAPNGTLAASDVVVRLDVFTYYLESIAAKMDREHDLAEWGTDDEKPQSDGKWKFFTIDSFTGSGLWVNYRHKAYHSIAKDHIARLKFIDRLAQSFAERNALKAHPSIPKRLEVHNGACPIDVHAWTSDFSREELKQLEDLIEQDRLHEFRYRSGRIEVGQQQIIEKMQPEDVHSMESELTDERSASGDTDDEEQKKELRSKAELLAQATDLIAKLMKINKAKCEEIINELQIIEIEEASDEDLAAFIDKATEALG